MRSFGRWLAGLPAGARSPRVAIVLGAALSAAGLAEALTRAAAADVTADSALVAALLALATTAPLALLGGAGAVLTIWAAGVLSLAAFHTLTLAGVLALLAAAYRWALDDPRPFGWRLAVPPVFGLPFLVLTMTGSEPGASEGAVLTTLLAVAAPAVALGGLAARAQREAVENRAARQVIADTLTEHMARGERARIARELHDVVAHHISMVAVQAESARLAVPGMPADGARRLSAIGDTARAALVEMRRLLGVLREDARAGVAARRPQPGLAQLAELLDEARSASTASTRLILRGTPIAIDPSVELVAYRIVQEALTNARRHAPGAAVDVELTYSDDSIGLRVRDNGPGPGAGEAAPVGAAGHGVVGMRERASAVGGSVRTGAAGAGGYLVEAVLPAKIEDAR